MANLRSLRANITEGHPFIITFHCSLFLYREYLTGKPLIKNETQISFEQIISGFQYCGLTNVIKCSTNSKDGRSKPSWAMYSNCSKKFANELQRFSCHTLICFSFFLWPSFCESLGSFENLISHDRYRILGNQRIIILELEHPLSTHITRKEKFKNYSKGVYDLVQITKEKLNETHNKANSADAKSYTAD